MNAALQGAERIVIKLGSALIVDRKNQTVRKDWINSLAADIHELLKAGKQIVLVSSGAAALGRIVFKKLLNEAGKEGQLELKQAASALGQPRLMTALQSAFDPFGIPLAQALLTLDDTETRRRWINARAALFTLLEHGAVPVINENDTVATAEIRYGDNDRLAARVAQMIGADLLILLSDIDGLYTADPRKNPGAKHIDLLTAITPDIRACAGAANAEAGVGTGGMATKLDAADIALSAGCSTLITLGEPQHPLKRLAENGRATWVRAELSPQAARTSWLSGHLTPEGAVIIDDGARKALMSGASLLAVGIRKVKGNFMRGAAIAIQTDKDETIAKGVSTYTSAEIELIKGLHSSALAGKLGYPARAAVIHRDDMVLLER